MIKLTKYIYKYLLKPILFLINPETVHHYSVRIGGLMGRFNIFKSVLGYFYKKEYNELEQKFFGINFDSPIGLAAGFDYEARLTQIMSSFGFGFGTIGTITNHPYDGNPKPMLGRLPKSKSLMVNKGFKNLGIQETLRKLKNINFNYPVGISIGKTNNPILKTQEEGVNDIVAAFKILESYNLQFSYYELNVSCPNLSGDIEFYDPEHLRQLLIALEKITISKPVFIKMPISKSNEEIKQMMDVIVQFEYIKAVIIGNLQRDRNEKTLNGEEINNFPKGNFSGLPCQARSEELISFVYKNYGSKIRIIGCGGTFNAEDAYKKIKLGASLVQLITGMIYEGPQIAAEINKGLVEKLRKDNFKNISDAIGTAK